MDNFTHSRETCEKKGKTRRSSRPLKEPLRSPKRESRKKRSPRRVGREATPEAKRPRRRLRKKRTVKIARKSQFRKRRKIAVRKSASPSAYEVPRPLMGGRKEKKKHSGWPTAARCSLYCRKATRRRGNGGSLVGRRPP